MNEQIRMEYCTEVALTSLNRHFGFSIQIISQDQSAVAVEYTDCIFAEG